jgi:hypothetical protein
VKRAFDIPGFRSNSPMKIVRHQAA